VTVGGWLSWHGLHGASLPQMYAQNGYMKTLKASTTSERAVHLQVATAFRPPSALPSVALAAAFSGVCLGEPQMHDR